MTSSPVTNYVLCAWSGERRGQDPRRGADPAIYLRTHLEWLRDLPHDLNQITIVIPDNPDEPPAFREFVESIPGDIDGTRVVIMERPNEGLSYGSLSDCYARYRERFAFYFFIEDDYVFVPPMFDQIHLQRMKEDPECGYLCGLAWGTPRHAGISNGVLRAEALERVFESMGRLPYVADASYDSNEGGAQIAQSQAIIEQGYTLLDWEGRYQVIYRETAGDTRLFNEDCVDVMMRPI